MKKDKQISRRTYLKRTLAIGTATIGALALEGCDNSHSHDHSHHHSDTQKSGAATKSTAKSSGLDCDDIKKLSKAEIQERASVNYMDHTPLRGKRCDNCMHYVPGKDGNCGTCHVVPGPIHPEGYCILYHSA